MFNIERLSIVIKSFYSKLVSKKNIKKQLNKLVNKVQLYLLNASKY